MKHHALPHHPTVVRHDRRLRPAVGVFEFSAEHFLLFPMGAAIAIVWANLAAESYFTFAQTFGFLVNDVGMAFFFALIAQEIVEAVMPGGALHSWRRWGVADHRGGRRHRRRRVHLRGLGEPEHQLVLLQAWPVACAMDIAVAYYVLKSISRRSGVLPFVLLLGIATNLFGIIIVALQGPPVETRTTGMVLVLVALGIALVLRVWRVPTFWPYSRSAEPSPGGRSTGSESTPLSHFCRSCRCCRTSRGSWTCWPRRPTTTRRITSSTSGTTSSRSSCFSSAW